MTAPRRYALPFLALCAFATPALADWEGTEWGMSPDAALAVVEDAQAHDPADSEIFEYEGVQLRPLIKLDHTVGTIAGEAALLFDNEDALASVVFTPADLAIAMS